MIVIIGAGVSGLSLAHYLCSFLSTNEEIVILESAPRSGGWILSEEPLSGVVIEQGPHTLRARGRGENTLDLIEDLHLTDQVEPILPSSPAASKRFVYARGKLNLLPMGFLGLLYRRPPFSSALIWSLMRDLVTPRPSDESGDESMYSFAARRFGKEVADYLISPFACGVVAGDARELSVQFLLKTPREWERRFGSVIAGAFWYGVISCMTPRWRPCANKKAKLCRRRDSEGWSVYKLKQGIETLVKALRLTLLQNGRVKIMTNAKCTAVRFLDRGNVEVEFSREGALEQLQARRIIFATSAPAAASVLEAGTVSSDHGELKRAAELLRSIPYVTVIVVCLVFEGQLIASEHNGFGHLVPPCEHLPVLGTIYDSCSSASDAAQKHTVLTVMMGGRFFNDHFPPSATHSDFASVARSHIKTVLGITKDPLICKVHTLQNCIPQYTVGHYERVAQLQDVTRDLPISFTGTFIDGVGVNDAIFLARQEAERVTAPGDAKKKESVKKEGDSSRFIALFAAALAITSTAAIGALVFTRIRSNRD